MIPADEISVLTATTRTAFDLAARGDREGGFHLLLSNQRRANDACAAGKTWAFSLAGHYRQVLDYYAQQYDCEALMAGR
jgi:hypothetical protein